jgi:hypothetical protein
MDKMESKNNMTVIHVAFAATKPVVPFTYRQSETKKRLDPSSCVRADRYPIPTSFGSRFDSLERDYA